jgi:hypothetical protein
MKGNMVPEIGATGAAVIELQTVHDTLAAPDLYMS